MAKRAVYAALAKAARPVSQSGAAWPWRGPNRRGRERYRRPDEHGAPEDELAA
jgi:hypothetical protein